MPNDPIFMWSADVVVDFDLLNERGGKLIYYNELTALHGFNTSPDVMFNNSLPISGPRALMLICSGPLDILNSAAALQVSFAAAAPNAPSISAFDTAFTAHGYTDAGGSPRTAEYKTAVTHYITTLPGTYTMCLLGVDVGTGSHNPQLNVGFRFYVVDLGVGY